MRQAHPDALYQVSMSDPGIPLDMEITVGLDTGDAALLSTRHIDEMQPAALLGFAMDGVKQTITFWLPEPRCTGRYGSYDTKARLRSILTRRTLVCHPNGSILLTYNQTKIKR